MKDEGSKVFQDKCTVSKLTKFKTAKDDPLDTQEEIHAKELKTDNLINAAFLKHTKSRLKTTGKTSTENFSIKEEFSSKDSPDFQELTRDDDMHDKKQETSNKRTKLISSVLKRKRNRFQRNNIHVLNVQVPSHIKRI